MGGLGDHRNDEARENSLTSAVTTQGFNKSVWHPRLFPSPTTSKPPVRRPPRRASIPSSRLAMDDEKRQQDDWASSRKNRLPSFTEVLSRRTRPPVDLFMF